MYELPKNQKEPLSFEVAAENFSIKVASAWKGTKRRVKGFVAQLKDDLENMDFLPQGQPNSASRATHAQLQNLNPFNSGSNEHGSYNNDSSLKVANDAYRYTPPTPSSNYRPGHLQAAEHPSRQGIFQKSAKSEPDWEAPPDSGFVTAKLRSQLCKLYEITQQDAQWAMEFGESAAMADVICFAKAVTGRPMEDAPAEALVCGFSKAKLANKYKEGETDCGSNLTPAQQSSRRKALAAFVEEEQAGEEDLEFFQEDEIERFQQETEDLDREAALKHLGVPGPRFDRAAVVAALHPGNGMAVRTAKENATRTAAYTVAIEVAQRG